MRVLLRAAVACVVAGAIFAPAQGQTKTTNARLAREGFRIGYGGEVPPERWAPLIVAIQPGTREQSLRLSVSYDQDPTQHAVIETNVTTTPGLPITVPMLVCLPVAVDRVSVELSTEGRVVSRTAFARAPADDELPLKQSLESGGLLVGSLGSRLPATAVDPWKVKGQTYSSGFEKAAIAHLAADDLTETWAGFDGLSVLVARQTVLESLPSSTLDALAAWVTGGGRLVLVTDAPGAAWRRFVPPGVHVGDMQAVKPAATLTGLLGPGAGLAASINARPIEVGPDATARGWTARQKLPERSGDRAQSLIASGPFGGGITVLTAFDPALASAELSDVAVSPLWVSLLTDALPDRPISAAHNTDDSPYSSSSGDGKAGSRALRTAVDALCNIPPVPLYVYTLIVVISVALALMVSFGDFFILGRFKARHRSWLTATAWVTVCAVLAWVLPNVVRRESTTLGRAAVIDSLPAGSGGGGAGALGTTAMATWQTGVTAVFAASSSGVPFQPAHSSSTGVKNMDLGGYWRGVSVLEEYNFRRSRSKATVDDLPMHQRISALDGAAGAVVPPSGGLALRRWTLRTLLDFGRASSTPSARFVRGGEGGTGPSGAYRVTGLPSGARVRSAAVLTAGGWAALTAENPSGTSGPGATTQFVPGAPQRFLADWHDELPKDGNGQELFSYEPAYQPARPSDYLLLDGARRRTAAFDALAAAGNFAVVHLLIDAPPDLTTPVPHTSQGVYVYRLAVPLPDKAPSAGQSSDATP